LKAPLNPNQPTFTKGRMVCRAELAIPSAACPYRRMNYSFCCVHRSRDSVGDLDPSNTWFFGPARVYRPIGTWIGSTVLQGSRTWSAGR